MLRGIFGQPKDLPAPFRGEPFALLEAYARERQLALETLDEDRRIWRRGDVALVFRQSREKGTLTLETQTSRNSIELSIEEEFDIYFSLVQLQNGIVLVQRTVYLWDNGTPQDVLDKMFDHIKLFLLKVKPESKVGHFRPYLNGRTFLTSWEAFRHFMTQIKRDQITSQASNYVSFDTGGLPLGLQKTGDGQSVIISYDLRDYEGLYDQHREQILDLINAVALRHRQICFLIDRERLLICNKFYVSPETDALNLFTAQLQAIHDALLDYLTTVQEAPDTAWLREARAAYLRQQPRPQA
ncbi:hypothetical protein [Deinococcus multiflagellatus]|uniref:DUF4268 domain-containing protein n=2 Tax=Deinococcus multiflagellatus TaxID=1656887 RepID=A0ABW1ZP08_9DEIO